MTNPISCSRNRCWTVVAGVLAAVLVVMVPSCRHNTGCRHADNTHFVQVDSLLKNIDDVDSLAAWAQRFHDKGDVEGEIVALKYYGRELRHRSRFDEALAVHGKGLEMTTAACDTLGMLSMMNNLGTDYRNMGNLSKANGFYYKVLQAGSVFSDTDCKECMIERLMALSGIGSIEFELRHYVQADSLFHQSLRGARALGVHRGMAINCLGIGDVKRVLGDIDSAWVYHNEALTHFQLMGNKNGEAQCHLNFGELYADERNYSHAEAEFKQAYDAFKEQGDTYFWLEACMSLADINIKMGETDEARRYLREAEAEALRIHSMEQQARVYYMYFDLAMKEGNVKQALEFHLKSDEMYDSIYGLEKNNEMRHQIAEYEANIKQGEMSVLNKDIQRLHRTRNLMGLFTMLLVLMAGAIIAALIYASRVRIRTQRLMRQVEETRSLFFTNVVHQLRTPLTAIMGATDSIVAQSTASGAEADADQRKNVEIIERQGHHLLLLVDRILEVGSVRSALKGPDWRTGDVVGYLRMIVESYRETCVDRQIELTYTSAEKEVEMDIVPNYLKTIVGSLIENAISYSNDYSKISVTSHVDGNNLVIKVADNGIGIGPDDLPHVFEPFYRAAAAEQMCGGVGIGLTVVRDMTNVLGGKATGESTLGSGSVFTVTLPRRQSGQEVYQRLEMALEPVKKVVHRHHENGEADASDQSRKGSPVILVVEDHNDVARLIGSALGTGFSVHYASNGEQGLARASELMPDLIITDIKMPYMDGLELCRRIRASRQLCHIPVIVLSARTSEEDRMRGFEAGADVYLVKPFNSVEIKLLTTKLLENRDMLRKVYSKTQSSVLLQDSSQAIADHAPDDEDFLDTFAQLVEEQLSGGKSRLNLDLIASRLKMGESQLKRRILELTGKNAVAYISQLRMEKAMRLLRERPNMLIGDVAAQCGFGDVAYFSRVFRQHYKMTPTEARKGDTLG